MEYTYTTTGGGSGNNETPPSSSPQEPQKPGGPNKKILTYGGLILLCSLAIGYCNKTAKDLVAEFNKPSAPTTTIVPEGENGEITLNPEDFELALGTVSGTVPLEVQTTVESDRKIFGELFNTSWDDATDNVKVKLEADYYWENNDFYNTAKVDFETIDGVDYAMIRFVDVPQPKLQVGSVRKAGMIEKTGEQDKIFSKNDLDRLNAAERKVEEEKANLFTRNVENKFNDDPHQCEKMFEALLSDELGEGTSWLRLFQKITTPDGIPLVNNPALKGKKIGISFTTEYKGNTIQFIQLEGKGPGKAKVVGPWKKINQILGLKGEPKKNRYTNFFTI